MHCVEPGRKFRERENQCSRIKRHAFKSSLLFSRRKELWPGIFGSWCYRVLIRDIESSSFKWALIFSLFPGSAFFNPPLLNFVQFDFTKRSSHFNTSDSSMLQRVSDNFHRAMWNTYFHDNDGKFTFRAIIVIIQRDCRLIDRFTITANNFCNIGRLSSSITCIILSDIWGCIF